MSENTRPNTNDYAAKRRFQRVLTDVANQEVNEIIGALAEWPGHRMTKIFDISYSGVALQKTAELNPRVGENVLVHFHLGGSADQEIDCRVIWMNSAMIGLEFSDKIDSSKKLRTFLQDKILGLNLKLVTKDLYPAGASYTQWFHGPKDTNIFLWKKGNATEKAILTTGENAVLYENNKFRSADLSSDFEETDLNIERFLKSHTALEDHDSRKFVEILSQIQEHSELISDLLNQLASSVK